ncbi:MAG: zinc-ribbon domain-containing protein, partial [Chloroflexota bacterium]
VAPTSPPEWPDTPAWPSPDPQATQVASPILGPATAPWASRLASARPEPGSVWAASSQEVLAAPGAVTASGPGPAVQPCVNCGLSLSANARFCRRCGTRQA